MVAWRKGARGLPANRPRNGSDRACPVCGTVHYRPANQDRIRYCSPECYRIGRWGRSRRVTRECVVCAKPFQAYESDRTVCCGRVCDNRRKSMTQSGDQSVLWRGGRTYPYVGTWKAQRRLVRERDAGMCQKCGSTDRPQVHHIVPARYGGTHDLSNLITLCRSCHSREEMLVNERYRRTLLKGSSPKVKAKTALDAV